MQKSMNYARFLSKAALNRKPSPIRELHPLLSVPGMISLGGGM
jgi:kynurenine/2-aminoadipate aminotransferase